MALKEDVVEQFAGRLSERLMTVLQGLSEHALKLLKSSEEYWLDVLIPAIKEMLLKLEQVSAVAEDCLKNGGETGDLPDALGNSKIEGTKSGDVLGEKSVTNTKPRAKGSCQKCGEVATPEHTCAKSFECTDCGVEFPSRSRLTAHFLRVHPLTSVESSEERGKGQSYLRSCGNRGVGANKTPHACEKRLRFKCETCGKLFPYRYRLNLHQVRAHPSQVSEELSSKGRTRYCRSCGKTVNTTAHVCERAHKCQVCERQFPYRYLLNRHLQTHSSIKDIQCEFCGKGFRTQTNYQEHRKIHLGLKPEQCHVCSRRFRNKTILTIHIRSHTGEKPYTCQTCGKSFARKGSLDVHSRIHLGLKPYKCNVCEFRCRQSQDLKRHLKRHAGAGVELLSENKAEISSSTSAVV